MSVDEERRRALVEVLRELAKVAGSVNKLVEEVREEIVESVETAIGVPIRPEKRALLELYRFKRGVGEDPERLKRLIAQYMGLGDGVDVVEYLRSLGRSSTGYHGEGRAGSTLNDAGDGGREEAREVHSPRS